MTTVRCELCQKWIFSPGDAIFFRRQDGRLISLEISSLNVWSGVLSVCLDCCSFLDTRTQHEHSAGSRHPNLSVQYRPISSPVSELPKDVRGLQSKD